MAALKKGKELLDLWSGKWLNMYSISRTCFCKIFLPVLAENLHGNPQLDNLCKNKMVATREFVQRLVLQ